MIIKNAMASDLLHIPLCPMDYVPGINYSAAVLYIGMKDSAKDEDIFKLLQEGLRRMFLQAPWLNGKLYRQS